MYILRTADATKHLAYTGVLMPRDEAKPLLFSTASIAFEMTLTQPDFAALVVDAAP